MKTHHSTVHVPRTITTAVASLLMLGLLAGCKTPAYKKSDTAAYHLQTTGREIKTEISNLDATVASMNDLVKKPSGDLRVQFGTFSKALDALAGSHKQVDSCAAKLPKKSADYFKMWDKEIAAMKDEEVRKASATRRNEVAAQYEAALQRYHAPQDELARLISLLNDIRRALGTDLTVKGTESVAPSAANATAKAESLRAALGKTAEDLDAMAVTMSSYTVAEPKSSS